MDFQAFIELKKIDPKSRVYHISYFNYLILYISSDHIVIMRLSNSTYLESSYAVSTTQVVVRTRGKLSFNEYHNA